MYKRQIYQIAESNRNFLPELECSSTDVRYTRRAPHRLIELHPRRFPCSSSADQPTTHPLLAEYCDKYVCLFVCPRAYLQKYTSYLYQFFVHVTYWRGSVFLWRRRDMLCTSGFMDDVILLIILHRSLFHSRLKTFLFCKSFSSSGLTPRIPRTVYRTSGLIRLYFLAFLFFHFLVVGSVR